MWWWCAGLHCSRTGTATVPPSARASCCVTFRLRRARAGQRCARASEAAVLRAALGLMSATHGDCPAELWFLPVNICLPPSAARRYVPAQEGDGVRSSAADDPSVSQSVFTITEKAPTS